MRYWLYKSEPDAYGIDDLERDRTTVWDGVRNYQARNNLTAAGIGDLVFFYHSSTTPPGIAGLCQVTETGVIDPTQFDPESKYFDPNTKPADPRWFTVKVKFVEKFAHYLPLEELRRSFAPDDLVILRRGNRLSVTPVSDETARADPGYGPPRPVIPAFGAWHRHPGVDPTSQNGRVGVDKPSQAANRSDRAGLFRRTHPTGPCPRLAS